jgi:hypothetical protein
LFWLAVTNNRDANNRNLEHLGAGAADDAGGAAVATDASGDAGPKANRATQNLLCK